LDIGGGIAADYGMGGSVTGTPEPLSNGRI